MITIKNLEKFLKDENISIRFKHSNTKSQDYILRVLDQTPEFLFRECIDFKHDLQGEAFWCKIEKHWMARILELSSSSPYEEYSIGPEPRIVAVYKTRGLNEDRDFTWEELEKIKKHILNNYPKYYTIKEYGNRILVFMKDVSVLRKEGE